jgi:hypothetical protein
MALKTARLAHAAPWVAAPIAAAALTAGALAAALTAIAPSAAADPVWPVAGAESASATIADLESQGYDVQINWVTGYSRAPLSRCRVSGIENPDRSGDNRNTGTTVYVDVVCPSDDWGRGGFGFGAGIG